MKILAVCGNGMGTSMIIKLKVASVLKKHSIDSQVESCSLGQAGALVRGFDVILSSIHLVSEIKGHNCIVGLKNLLDEKELEEKLLPLLKK